MKFSKDLGFATVYRDKPIDAKLEDVFKNAFSVNKKTFKRVPKNFKIIVCDTEPVMKREAKYYYQKWMTATVLRNRNMVLRSQKFSKWSPKDYRKLMVHEMNHVFWQSFYGLCKPVWLDEGFACHVGGNFIYSNAKMKKLVKEYGITYHLLDYRYLYRKFKGGHIPKYPLWATFTRYIANKHSTAKLVRLMDLYAKKPTRVRYDILFKQIFGKSEKEMFDGFLWSL